MLKRRFMHFPANIVSASVSLPPFCFKSVSSSRFQSSSKMRTRKVRLLMKNSCKPGENLKTLQIRAIVWPTHRRNYQATPPCDCRSSFRDPLALYHSAPVACRKTGAILGTKYHMSRLDLVPFVSTPSFESFSMHGA